MTEVAYYLAVAELSTGWGSDFMWLENASEPAVPLCDLLFVCHHERGQYDSGDTSHAYLFRKMTAEEVAAVTAPDGGWSLYQDVDLDLHRDDKREFYRKRNP